MRRRFISPEDRAKKIVKLGVTEPRAHVSGLRICGHFFDAAGRDWLELRSQIRREIAMAIVDAVTDMKDKCIALVARDTSAAAEALVSEMRELRVVPNTRRKRAGKITLTPAQGRLMHALNGAVRDDGPWRHVGHHLAPMPMAQRLCAMGLIELESRDGFSKARLTDAGHAWNSSADGQKRLKGSFR